MMCQDHERPLTLEGLLHDPLTRMVMAADGVSESDFATVMYSARKAVIERQAIAERGAEAARDVIAARGSFAMCVAAVRRATNARA
jgi:putative intracellular protease/amidase